METILKECSKHGMTCYILVSHSGNKAYYRCQKCRSGYVTNWRKKLKFKLVEEFGGKCQICGYCKCQQALQFHHIDPKEKEFSIAQNGIARAYEKSREEARKCILLCANCHTEVENGVTELPVK